MEIRFVRQNVNEQLVSDLLRKNAIEEKLDAFIAKIFHIDEAPGMLGEPMTLTSVMGPIATFHSRNADTAMEDKNSSTIIAPKGLGNIIPTLRMI